MTRRKRQRYKCPPEYAEEHDEIIRRLIKRTSAPNADVRKLFPRFGGLPKKTPGSPYLALRKGTVLSSGVVATGHVHVCAHTASVHVVTDTASTAQVVVDGVPTCYITGATLGNPYTDVERHEKMVMTTDTIEEAIGTKKRAKTFRSKSIPPDVMEMMYPVFVPESTLVMASQDSSESELYAGTVVGTLINFMKVILYPSKAYSVDEEHALFLIHTVWDLHCLRLKCAKRKSDDRDVCLVAMIRKFAEPPRPTSRIPYIEWLGSRLNRFGGKKKRVGVYTQTVLTEKERIGEWEEECLTPGTETRSLYEELYRERAQQFHIESRRSTLKQLSVVNPTDMFFVVIYNSTEEAIPVETVGVDKYFPLICDMDKHTPEFMASFGPFYAKENAETFMRAVIDPAKFSNASPMVKSLWETPAAFRSRLALAYAMIAAPQWIRYPDLDSIRLYYVDVFRHLIIHTRDIIDESTDGIREVVAIIQQAP
jgi:hypothetical protein